MNVNDKCVGIIGVYKHKIKIVGYGIYKGFIKSSGIDDMKQLYSNVHELIETEPYMQLPSGTIYSGKDVRIISIEEFKKIKYSTLEMYGKVDIQTTDVYYTNYGELN